DGLEVFHHGMKHVALSCLAIDVGHFFHVRKHPHKSAFVPDVNLGVATFWQRASATSQTERGASGLDQHGRASTARNAPRGKLPAAVTLPRPWVGSSAS